MDHPRLRLDRRDLLRFGGAMLLAGAARPAFALAPATKPVQTSNGPVRGYLDGGVSTFKGVRYAAPPTGANRFRPPQPLTPWTEPVEAIAFGRPAVQMYTRPSGEPSSALGKSLLGVFPTAQETRDGNEDCLVLNVWTPAADTKLKRPVMVWIHGGGYAYGSAAWPAYDGANLARKGEVVVVGVNHRLNVFGFSALGDTFGAEYKDSGAAGLLDLIAALKWVQANAEAFGGDPGNVTLFGQSGGGGKIAHLLAAPGAKGLFHKAIIQSGPTLKGARPEAAHASAEAWLRELGLGKGDLAALQARPSGDLITAAYAVQAKSQAGGPRLTAEPVVDGGVLVRDPFTPDAPEQAADVPLLIGTNKDETALFMASQPWFGKLTEEELAARATMFGGANGEALLAALHKARPGYSPTFLATALATASGFTGNTATLADRKAAQAAPVFMYRMDWETPIGGGVYRAGHSVETPLMFDTVEANRALLGPGPDPQAVADQMSAAWLAFAHKGDPSAANLPAWPRYDATTRATMIFNVKSQVVNDPDAEVRQILQS